MQTDKQTQANRQNALRSTCPRTPEGQAPAARLPGAKRTQTAPPRIAPRALRTTPRPRAKRTHFRRHPPRSGAPPPIHRRPVLRHLPRRWGISPSRPFRPAHAARLRPHILNDLGAPSRSSLMAGRVLLTNGWQTARAALPVSPIQDLEVLY